MAPCGADVVRIFRPGARCQPTSANGRICLTSHHSYKVPVSASLFLGGSVDSICKRASPHLTRANGDRHGPPMYCLQTWKVYGETSFENQAQQLYLQCGLLGQRSSPGNSIFGPPLQHDIGCCHLLPIFF
jgi:hypothetical protein